MEILGIDIGGTGIKGAPVDTERGVLTAERQRIDTPKPARPEDVAEVVAQIVNHFDWKGPFGCTMPTIVRHGVVYSAANIDKSWIGTDAAQLFHHRTGLPVAVVNDADAAGIAEMQFGAGWDKQGVVIILTFGTGIGSALFVNGILVPNTELGHLEIRGKDAEHRASEKVRVEKELSWEKWAERVNEYLQHVEFLFSPDLFIVGGGASKKADRFLPLLDLKTPIVPALLLNDAGIVGAAMDARELV
jgi:polyphosphate glucokinase